MFSHAPYKFFIKDSLAGSLDLPQNRKDAAYSKVFSYLGNQNNPPDMIIKNTYRTLMTRGMKGCYVYSVDQETQQYFQNQLKSSVPNNISYSNTSDGASLNIDK